VIIFVITIPGKAKWLWSGEKVEIREDLKKAWENKNSESCDKFQA